MRFHCPSVRTFFQPFLLIIGLDPIIDGLVGLQEWIHFLAV